MFGHQIGDELVAVNTIEPVGLLKRHTEEFGAQTVPEW